MKRARERDRTRPRPRRARWVALALPSLLAPPGVAAQVGETDSVAVHSVAEEIIRADNARDLARVLETYSDTALLIPPDAPPVQGRSATRPRYASLFEEYVPELESDVHEVRAFMGSGYVLGRTRGRFRGRDGREDRTVEDDYLMIVARESDGVWRIIRLIWNAHRPAGSP